MNENNQPRSTLLRSSTTALIQRKAKTSSMSSQPSSLRATTGASNGIGGSSVLGNFFLVGVGEAIGGEPSTGEKVPFTGLADGGDITGMLYRSLSALEQIQHNQCLILVKINQPEHTLPTVADYPFSGKSSPPSRFPSLAQSSRLSVFRELRCHVWRPC